jgi:alkyl hydroperoxide reductase subunit AhpC
MASETMKDIWRDAEAHFGQITGKSLKDRQHMSLNDCMALIDKISEPDEGNEDGPPDTKATKEKTKERWRNALQFFKVLGSIAAQAVEIAGFPPAGTAFSALSFLLDIPQKIHTFHEAIDGLYEHLWPSLSSFRIYEKMDHFNTIEPELRNAIHKLMIKFVDICALSIQLRDSRKWESRWHRTSKTFKLVMFGDDCGVQAAISSFKDLAAAQTSIQATQSLKFIMDGNGDVKRLLLKASETGKLFGQIAADVGKLAENDEKRKADDTWKNNKETIREKLKVDKKTLDSTKEAGDQLWVQCVPETAQWFKHTPEFATWADSSNTEVAPLLRLTGESSSGKSVIMSAMYRHLRGLANSDKAGPRMLVVAHFFPQLTGKDEDRTEPASTAPKAHQVAGKNPMRKAGVHESEDKKKPVETAIKCLAYQLAEIDEVYAKALVQRFKDTGTDITIRDGTCQELWDFLGIGLARGNSVHYMVLDGLSTLPDTFKEARDKFLSIVSQSNKRHAGLRVVLSWRPPKEIQLVKTASSTLRMEDHNQLDIEKYIAYDLKKEDFFPDDDEQSIRRRNKIQKKLAETVNGSFGKVETALEQIRLIVTSDGRESEVDAVLEESNKGENAMLKTSIHQLQEKLDAAQVKELNEVLIWVAHGKGPFTVDQLVSATFIRSGVESMVSLKRKILREYSSLLSIDNESRVTLNNGMKDLLNTPRTESRTADASPKFKVDISITKADLTSVQSFLWNLIQKTGQDSLRFEEITEQSKLKGRIQVNESDAHLAILRSTFIFLKEPYDAKHESLGSYMLEHLPFHLKALETATGHDALTDTEFREIGTGLFDFLVSHPIQTHWDAMTSISWHCDPDLVQTFVGWLTKPSVTKYLGGLDREWIAEVEKDSHPCRRLLSRLTKKVAWLWLRDSSNHVYWPTTWVRQYLDMVSLGILLKACTTLNMLSRCQVPKALTKMQMPLT